MDRLALGILGEDLVARHLASRGCRIRHRRWKNASGEIDLVAEDRGEVVFIEVKTRRGDGFGLPEDAVTARKRKHLRAVAYAYLAAHGLEGHPFRIDVAAVAFPPVGRPRIDYFMSAVGEED
jgi:putative endonuclease